MAQFFNIVKHAIDIGLLESSNLCRAKKIEFKILADFFFCFWSFGKEKLWFLEIKTS